MAKASRNERIRRMIQQIEEVLNEPIPGTPNISGVRRNSEGQLQGRVMYVALPGSKRKSRDVLSRRAQQVLGQINRTGRATAAVLMDALEVNRNVIAGAVHELKQAGFLKTRGVADSAFASEYKPRNVNKRRK